MYIKHFMIPPLDQKLPVYIESVGFMSNQMPIYRKTGYPCYHWLHTVQGQGEFYFGGSKVSLLPGHGILLLPGVAHRYFAKTETWTTYFITFGGAMIQQILSAMELYHLSVYRLQDCSMFTEVIDRIIEKVNQDREYNNLVGSAELYHFLALIKQFGQSESTPASHSSELIEKIVDWVEVEYMDPDLSLQKMADVIRVSPQYLNKLFHRAFGNSPYGYLIQLRIQKAKECFSLNPNITVKEVTALVGFKYVSHFVSTFRRIVGITPNQFKDLYHS